MINQRLDGDDIVVSLYGEVQKEVLEATLVLEHGVSVTFRETRTACVEKLRGVGEAVRYLGESPYAAGTGFRVEPGPEEFRLEALGRAGTVTCEPMHRFRLKIPADVLPAVLAALGKLGGVPLTTTATVLKGHIPAVRVPPWTAISRCRPAWSGLCSHRGELPAHDHLRRGRVGLK